MVESQEVVDYLLNNLNLKNCTSMILGGSSPEKLNPQTDFDIFVVIDEKNKDAFFDNLQNIMDKFVKENPSVVYSLFRGPIRFEKKGLIHFAVFTESKKPDPLNKELFINESKAVLVNLLNEGKVKYGKSVRDLLKGVNLETEEKTDYHLKRLQEKLEILKNESTVNYPEWKKTKEGWRLLRTELKVEGFLKDYLMRYYEKYL